MGNLKARLKSTLLRRNTRSPSLSSNQNYINKNSLDGRDGTSSVSTNLQPGYEASDEQSQSSRGRSLKCQDHDNAPTEHMTSDAPSPTNNNDDIIPAVAAATEQRQLHQGNHHERRLDDRIRTPVGDSDGDEPDIPPKSQARQQQHQAPPPSSAASLTATIPGSGNDQHPAANNPSSSPFSTPSALPSIHEHPASPPRPRSTSPIPTVKVDDQGQYDPAQNDGVSPLPDHYFHSPSLLAASSTSPYFSRTQHPQTPPDLQSRPNALLRKQSLLPPHQADLVRALLYGQPEHPGYEPEHEPDSASLAQLIQTTRMPTRKIWVKRPSASATLVTINDDDVVDDVRDMILRKYANSLGRQFDAPDIILRICSRDQHQTNRTLQPDEPICKVLDSYYPTGQTVDDALLIDIPGRRTPKASPNPRFLADDRPHESGTDYFPPYPPPPHTHHPGTHPTIVSSPHAIQFPPSMTILSGGQLPPLPSPGSGRRLGRPKVTRMHTASPVSTVATTHMSQNGAPPVGTHNSYPRSVRSRTHSGASSDQSTHAPPAPAIPTPPPIERTATPPPRVSSPRPPVRPKKSKKSTSDQPTLPSGLLDTTVPPINILIVEDNVINLRLLEAFVKRLKVRWQTAVNGREAVDKWRAGGFHLVLMDIQLPIMSGLEATREIRRIERVNSIGVFSSSASSPPIEILQEPAEEDKLANTEMFKSPVIIVALTASALQSDRQEALAAGCNDFLTKPVRFDWLQRKVKEWGCMQALIDFDGWRKWKDFSQKTQADEAAKKAAAAAAAKSKPIKKNRLSMTTAAA